MAIDFGRAARGIATGYLSAKVADTAAQDELNRDFILQATNQYFNVDKPNFVADEKKRSANIDFISSNCCSLISKLKILSNSNCKLLSFVVCCIPSFFNKKEIRSAVRLNVEAEKVAKDIQEEVKQKGLMAKPEETE